ANVGRLLRIRIVGQIRLELLVSVDDRRLIPLLGGRHEERLGDLGARGLGDSGSSVGDVFRVRAVRVDELFVLAYRVRVLFLVVVGVREAKLRLARILGIAVLSL